MLRSIRDSFTHDVKEILVDTESVHNEIKDFIQIISPKHTRIVKLYKGDKPIFTKYELESQIASIYENRVDLKSGGSIVIDQTEALVRHRRRLRKKHPEALRRADAYPLNLEAAEEIARQLRLRDLGGLIVIDFIDMRESKHKLEVERTLKSFIKLDKARIKVGRISRFGLLEMSRQRIRPSIEFGSHIACPHCRGKGMTPSTETLGIAFLRQLGMEHLKGDVTRVKGVVPPAVADCLLNKKRKDLLELEARRGVVIEIEGDASLVPGESRIIRNP